MSIAHSDVYYSIKCSLIFPYAMIHQVPDTKIFFGRNSTVGHTKSGFCNEAKSLRTDSHLTWLGN